MTTSCFIHDKGLCIEVIKVGEVTNNLVGWQKSQNGRLTLMDNKLDKLNGWIISLLCSIIVAVLLLAINLALGRL